MATQTLTDLKRTFYRTSLGYTEGQVVTKTLGDLEKEFFEAVAAGTFTAPVINATNEVRVAGTKVVGARGAAVADAVDAATTQARLNDLLARLRAHGLIAP